MPVARSAARRESRRDPNGLMEKRSPTGLGAIGHRSFYEWLERFQWGKWWPRYALCIIAAWRTAALSDFC
jgi:hypothetical protein